MALHQFGGKSVKASLYRSVCCEEVAGPSDRERSIKGYLCIFHIVQCPFQDRKGCVAFIEMADLGPDSEFTKQPPSTDSQHLFLADT